MRIVLFAALVLAPLSASSAEHEADRPAKPRLVVWYGLSCTYCRNFANDLKKDTPEAAALLRVFDVVWIDGDKHPVQRALAGVKGYPTFVGPCGKRVEGYSGMADLLAMLGVTCPVPQDPAPPKPSTGSPPPPVEPKATADAVQAKLDELRASFGDVAKVLDESGRTHGDELKRLSDEVAAVRATTTGLVGPTKAAAGAPEKLERIEKGLGALHEGLPATMDKVVRGALLTATKPTTWLEILKWSGVAAAGTTPLGIGIAVASLLGRRIIAKRAEARAREPQMPAGQRPDHLEETATKPAAPDPGRPSPPPAPPSYRTPPEVATLQARIDALKAELAARPQQVITVENPPPPQVTAPEVRYQQVETDSYRKAVAYAISELGKKYPASTGYFESMQSLAQQWLSAQPASSH
jgi:hypothetical protein